MTDAQSFSLRELCYRLVQLRPRAEPPTPGLSAVGAGAHADSLRAHLRPLTARVHYTPTCNPADAACHWSLTFLPCMF